MTITVEALIRSSRSIAVLVSLPVAGVSGLSNLISSHDHDCDSETDVCVLEGIHHVLGEPDRG